MENGYAPHTERLQKVDAVVRDFFERQLPNDRTSAPDAPRSDGQLYYHGIAHTLDLYKGVVAVTSILAQAESVTEDERELLVAAAYFHDTGFSIKYLKNEPCGVMVARDHLPSLGFNPDEIEAIQKLILVTDITTMPDGLLEKIIRDADVDNLGRDDFQEMSDKLRNELNLEESREWYENQVAFLENHTYFTDTAQKRRGRGKARNLELARQKLREEAIIRRW